MRLIAIAQIYDKDKAVGLRLLDIDTLKVKDTPLLSVKEVLARGVVSIENVGIENGELVGTNGSIDRLTKLSIADEELGKTPYVIIDQIEEIGYIMANYRGIIRSRKNEDALYLARQRGIANGKVVNKEGKEFISSIRGEYNKIPREKVKEMLNGKNAYTGKLLGNKRALYPIALDSYNNSTKILQCPYTDRLGYYSCGEIYEYSMPFFRKEEIKKGLVYELGKFTIVNKYVHKLDLRKKEEREILLKALNNYKFRAELDNTLEKEVRYYTEEDEYYDKEYNMIRPHKRTKEHNGLTYSDIIINEALESDIVEDSKLSTEQQIYYLKRVKLMKVAVIWAIKVPFTQLAVSRRCTSSGIEYTVVTKTNQDTALPYTHRIPLEELYTGYKEYSNVMVTDNMMCIAGVDGVYMYDMNIISSEYGRTAVEDSANTKAKLLGSKFNIQATEAGLLRDLKCDKITYIPDNILNIGVHSINPENCESLTIGEGVIGIEPNCFSGWSSNSSIKYLAIKNCKCEKSFIAMCIYNSLMFNRTGVVIDFLGSCISEYGCAHIKLYLPEVELKHNGKAIIISDYTALEIFKHKVREEFNSFKWLNYEATFRVTQTTICAKNKNDRVGLEPFNKFCDTLISISSKRVEEEINKYREQLNEKYEARRLEAKAKLLELMAKYPDLRCSEDEILR